jgi:hypothetical protein
MEMESLGKILVSNWGLGNMVTKGNAINNKFLATR